MPLTPENPNLYYDYLQMEFYYFNEQYEDNIEIIGLLDLKCVFFIVWFQKNCIFN